MYWQVIPELLQKPQHGLSLSLKHSKSAKLARFGGQRNEIGPYHFFFLNRQDWHAVAARFLGYTFRFNDAEASSLGLASSSDSVTRPEATLRFVRPFWWGFDEAMECTHDPARKSTSRLHNVSRNHVKSRSHDQWAASLFVNVYSLVYVYEVIKQLKSWFPNGFSVLFRD